MLVQHVGLIYFGLYLHACYAILYPKGMGSEIEANDKTNELLSIKTVCRNDFHNVTTTHTCYKWGHPQCTYTGI